MKTGTKKFLCTALTAAMVLPMVACGSNGGNAGNNSNGGSKTAKVAGLEKTEVQMVVRYLTSQFGTTSLRAVSQIIARIMRRSMRLMVRSVT
jgi:hypothetical protein